MSDLVDLANKINVCAAKSDNYRVTAARHLAEAKAECARRASPFKQWVKDNIKFSYDEARKLAVCGESDDPAKAIADMRASATTRKQKQRAVGRHTAAKGRTPKAKAERVELLHLCGEPTGLSITRETADELLAKAEQEHLRAIQKIENIAIRELKAGQWMGAIHTAYLNILDMISDEIGANAVQAEVATMLEELSKRRRKIGEAAA